LSFERGRRFDPSSTANIYRRWLFIDADK